MKNILIYSFLTLSIFATTANAQRLPEQKSVDLSKDIDFNAQLIPVKTIDPDFIKENVDAIEKFRQQKIDSDRLSRENIQREIDELEAKQHIMSHSLYTGYNNETHKIDAFAAQREFQKRMAESKGTTVIKEDGILPNWLEDFIDSSTDED